MKRVATPRKPVVAVPVVVVAIHVHLALIVPMVEDRVVRIECHPCHHPLKFF